MLATWKVDDLDMWAISPYHCQLMMWRCRRFGTFSHVRNVPPPRQNSIATLTKCHVGSKNQSSDVGFGGVEVS
ncbi:hypothetical protein AMTR_s00049p00173140 [Amborella trichopoda]|uniref:Uncharacterized protein n=1 Tax=Amborella trichopoda TaxID=13333 RepID=W1Q0V4_AMBTC|nr:hypothetical protein AMTR_s00049p00173140 [Amborella trichopoda]